jgi:hypothetical protein
MFCWSLFDARGGVLHIIELDDETAMALFEHGWVLLTATGARLAFGRVGVA